MLHDLCSTNNNLMIQTQIKQNEKQKKERGEEIKKLKELEKEKEFYRGESNFLTLTKLTSFYHQYLSGYDFLGVE